MSSTHRSKSHCFVIFFCTTLSLSLTRTHTHKLHLNSNDLKWVKSNAPEQTREQLEGWLPKEKWGEVNLLWVGFGQEVQQQKEKILRKVLQCSTPKEGIALLKILHFDVGKEAKRFGLEMDLEKVMKN